MRGGAGATIPATEATAAASGPAATEEGGTGINPPVTEADAAASSSGWGAN